MERVLSAVFRPESSSREATNDFGSSGILNRLIDRLGTEFPTLVQEFFRGFGTAYGLKCATSLLLSIMKKGKINTRKAQQIFVDIDSLRFGLFIALLVSGTRGALAMLEAIRGKKDRINSVLAGTFVLLCMIDASDTRS